MDTVEMDDCLADVSKPINVYSLFFSSMPTIESVASAHINPDQRECVVPAYADTKNLGGLLATKPTIRIQDYYPAFTPYDQMANVDTHMACSRY